MKKKLIIYITQRTSFLAGISMTLEPSSTRIKLRLELMDKNTEKEQIKNDIKTMEMV